MFSIYLDKEFVSQFGAINIRQNHVYEDLIAFFKKLKQLRIITNLNDLGAMRKSVDEGHLFWELIENVKVEFQPNFMDVLGNKAFMNDIDCFSLFFTENKAANVKSREYGFEAMTSGEVEERWRFYMLELEAIPYQLPANDTDKKLLDAETLLTSWKDVKSFSLPAHAAIFFDRYQFTSKPKLSWKSNFEQIFHVLALPSSARQIECIHVVKESNSASTYDKLSNEDKLGIHHDLGKIKKARRMQNAIIFQQPGSQQADFKDRFIYTNNFKFIPSHGTTVWKDDGFADGPGYTFRQQFVFRYSTMCTVKLELQRIRKLFMNLPQMDKDTEGRLIVLGERSNRLIDCFEGME